MSKKNKLIIAVASILVVVAVAATLMICFPRANWISEKRHIERVSKRVEKRYMTKDSKYDYTDYTVYPLYDENDKLGYFLVEFEPYGFVYVIIREKQRIVYSMYSRGSGEGWPWQRYTVVEDGKMQFEVDENGEEIFYRDSHFKVAGIENDKRYLFRVNHQYGYIPAVKRGDKYLNLVSMEEFDIDTIKDETIYQAVADFGFTNKPLFNL